MPLIIGGGHRTQTDLCRSDPVLNDKVPPYLQGNTGISTQGDQLW
jgi:hypothetical protein